MSTFDYPVLSRADIISILAESQIAAVTDNDFKNIKPDFVSNLYTRLLIYLDALNEEDQGQFEFSALEQIENPDLLIGSFQIMNLYGRLREVMESLKCPMLFNLRDLVKPDPRRTEHFLSAILNFCLYKFINKKLLHSPLQSGQSNCVISFGVLKTASSFVFLEKLNAEIAGYSEARERELPLVQEVESKVKELHEMICVFNSNQMSLRTSIRNLKEKNGQMDEKISEAEFDLVQSVQENANLRSKIVQSPDKIQDSRKCLEVAIGSFGSSSGWVISDLYYFSLDPVQVGSDLVQRALEEKLARDDAKSAERSAMESFQQKLLLLRSIARMHHEKALKKMSKHFALMQAIQEQVNSAKSVEKECKNMKAKLGDDAVLDKSLEAKLMPKPLAFSFTMKSEVLSKRLELEARQKKVEDVVTEVDSITLKTGMVRESGAAKVQQLISKCEELVKQFQEYSSSIGLLLPVDECGTKQLDSIAITSI
ncbi:Kinetochore protein nuf2 isoform 3 [Hibiscus syriacus]|uniref:Kinetochore protein nuf2 isoform 3 n=1 Tax=Hibiscus syriacus TaxID=106335 RepID=A0A6A2WCX8_HIBSY|nr:Kinetochore protein nuf2 isoform 3 [Hibiscus syriacus]